MLFNRHFECWPPAVISFTSLFILYTNHTAFFITPFYPSPSLPSCPAPKTLGELHRSTKSLTSAEPHCQSPNHTSLYDFLLYTIMAYSIQNASWYRHCVMVWFKQHRQQISTDFFFFLTPLQVFKHLLACLLLSMVYAQKYHLYFSDPRLHCIGNNEKEIWSWLFNRLHIL